MAASECKAGFNADSSQAVIERRLLAIAIAIEQIFHVQKLKSIELLP